MKKLLLGIGCCILFAACTKNAEQIDVVKTKMKTGWKMTDEEISKYKFKTDEVLDKDVYNIISKGYTKRYHEYADTNIEMAKFNVDEAGKFIALAEKASNKTFFIVKAYSLAAGDTIHNKIFYIDDKNLIIDTSNLK